MPYNETLERQRMFNSRTFDKDTKLQEAIDEIYREMAQMTSESDEYSSAVTQLVKLYSLKEDNSSWRVSPDTLVMVAGNLLGIILIVGHERMNVVTSKALNFVMKLR